MLVRDFIQVPVPLDAAVAGVGDPAVWEGVLTGHLNPPEHSVFTRFGMQGLFGSAVRPMAVRIGRTAHLPRGTIVDVQWGYEAPSGWEAVVQADATLSALAASTVHLEFNGCILGSAAISPSPADRVMQHRVVEYAVRLILTRLADSLRPTGVPAAQAPVTPTTPLIPTKAG